MRPYLSHPVGPLLLAAGKLVTHILLAVAATAFWQKVEDHRSAQGVTRDTP